jgi:hypothetical protein
MEQLVKGSGAQGITQNIILFLAVCLMVITLPAQSEARRQWYSAYGITSKYELTAPSSVPKMIEALSDRSANIRKAAAGILSKIGPVAKTAVPELMRVMVTDSNANVRKSALIAINKVGYRGSDYLAALEKMGAEDSHTKLRAYAAKLAGKLKIEGVRAVSQTSARVPATTSTGSGNFVIDFPKAEKQNRYAIAVIIGNRNYATINQDVPNVDFALNDADAMYRYVTESLGYREGNVILLKDATQADLVSTFGTKGNHKGKLYDWLRPGESEVFVYYSGHGAPGLRDGRGYLLPVDANPMKVELNGYPLDTLYANIGKLPAKDVTMVLDACFSGSSASGSVVRSASSIALKVVKSEVSVPKATVVTAAGLSEVASWDKEAGLGLLTRHFLEGVIGGADGEFFGNQDGQVTVAELKKFLGEEVTYKARRLYGRDQNPQVRGNKDKVIFSAN